MNESTDLSGRTYDLDSVTRTVADDTRDGQQVAVLTLDRVYPTSVEDLWDACTAPERIRRWFLPVSGELEPGGRYQIEGHAGGLVQACTPPRAFDATWEYGDAVSWIAVRVDPVDDGARLTLVHTTGIDGRWAEFGPGAVGVGWDSILNGIAVHLATGGAQIDPAVAMAWLSSPDGVRFVTASADAWCAAAVAAGADPAEARAAADRTTAAYTATE